ncbi:protein translocase subunit SecD [Adhaeretor mobilis]|uniref:Multifunctional fusion protein n=1 Tax=Adhaeretor mobilis TaxID=1930276 RepID=A0A517N0F5_9BACT|nr:protein translocase subunit SecD [Adhaeretor mobilis]QDT00584.1 bifunctional preprotein translocase subunit SecD/SecF [Adhaeretor mobilis]
MLRNGHSLLTLFVLGLALFGALSCVTPTIAQETGDQEAVSETQADDEVAVTTIPETGVNPEGSAAGPTGAIETNPTDVAEELTDPSSLSGFVLLAIVIALFVIPTFIGGWLAKRWKMADHGWKISLALGTIAAALVVISTGEVKLGPDLSGGITLIYELADGAQESEDGDADRGDDSKIDMDGMIKALVERVDPSGTKEVTIRKYGEGQIEIIIPKASPQELELIQRQITTAGKLEFRITASEKFRKHQTIIKNARSLKPGKNEVRIDDKLVAKWVKFREGSPIDNDNGGTYVKRTVGDTKQALVLFNDGLDVTGDDLKAARVGVDQTNQPAVKFTMKPNGAWRFGQLTGNHLENASGAKYQLGILIDQELKSAPSINGRISSDGEISGLGTQEESEFLVGILKAGSLPANLNKIPISQEQISPTLGAETIEKGKLAIGISLAAVVVFMLFYYRFAGVVACVALAVNLILILGSMMLISGAFTLPGLAGLVLTVGMSVDANVLIFERIREELNRGAALRMAVRNGFARATQTIVDANITTLITAIVIYKIAPDSVKGFGVTLILGILMSMYTAIFLSRLVFDIAEKLKFLKGLSMGRILGETSIDFLGKRGIAATLSAIVIAIGIFGISGRGADLLNIDFTGGSSVTMVLNKENAMDFSDVKAVLDGSSLKDKNLSLVEVGEDNTHYRVTSVEEDVEAVQEMLEELFGEKLQTYKVNYDKVKPLGDDQASAGVPQSENRLRELDLLGMVPTPSTIAWSSTMVLQVAQAEPREAAAEETAEQPAVEIEEQAEGESEDTSGEDAIEEVVAEEGSEAEKEADDATVTSSFSSESDQFANGTSTHLTFSGSEGLSGLTYDALVQALADALKATGNEGVAVEISNDEYLASGGTARAFADWDVKLALPEAAATEVLAALQKKTNAQAVFPLANKIGGRVAGNMKKDAIAAVVICLVGIIGYIWFRFQRVMYGLAAVLALVHDVAVTLGVIALSGYLVSSVPELAGSLMIEKFQLSLPIVAALLTIIGYSLNDTIVVFDRIREVKGKSPTLTREMINESINQTLSRTLLTSLTTLITVLILYVFGGDGIHGFAFALVIGVIVGTYSSIFIASPALLWMSQRAEAAASKGQVGGSSNLAGKSR